LAGVGEMDYRYLALDIETSVVGITCAATLTSDTGELNHWYTPANGALPADQMGRVDALRLLKYLAAMVVNGYTILTWNGLKFDFRVLAEGSGMFDGCKELALGCHVDMMFQIVCLRGHRLGLDVAAKGMGLPGKLEGMDGDEAAQLWAEGERETVLDYVAQDVRTTMELGRTCEKLGFLKWTSRGGNQVKMPLSSWLTVSEALSLPERAKRSEHTMWLAAHRPQSEGQLRQRKEGQRRRARIAAAYKRQQDERTPTKLDQSIPQAEINSYGKKRSEAAERWRRVCEEHRRSMEANYAERRRMRAQIRYTGLQFKKAHMITQEGKCVRCGIRFDNSNLDTRAELDHKTPLVSARNIPTLHTLKNTWLLCHRCHLAKTNGK